MTSRMPDYEIGAIDSETGTQGNVGVGWKADDGSGRITIKLNPFIENFPVGERYTMSLFPIRGRATVRSEETEYLPPRDEELRGRRRRRT